jgi:hypothetical protein
MSTEKDQAKTDVAAAFDAIETAAAAIATVIGSSGSLGVAKNAHLTAGARSESFGLADRDRFLEECAAILRNGGPAAAALLTQSADGRRSTAAAAITRFDGHIDALAE